LGLGAVFLLLVQQDVLAGGSRAPYNVGRVSEPRLFAEGIISTQDDEAGGTFSPDGSEFYFVKFTQYTTFPRMGLICVSHFRHAAWSQPEVVSFSGRDLDFPPKISPDGKTMYFSSFRPAPGKAEHAFRMWAVDRVGDGWGEPRLLPATVNAEKSANFAPSVTRDRTLYFTSTREGGKPHIYRSRFVDGSYIEPEKLGPEINSEFNESDPYISPDETVLIFASSANNLGEPDRPETLHGGGVLYSRADLYISTNIDRKWSQARHLGSNINSVAEEGSPSLTPDGKYLFFSSERSPFTVPTAHPLKYDEIEAMLHSTLNGHGNIFFISSDVLDFSNAHVRK